MAEYAVSTANAQLDAIEAEIGQNAVMKIFAGIRPATCAAADNGTVLAMLALGADWMAAAANGVKAKNGTWQDGSADASGNATYYRIYAADGVTCKQQGSVGLSGSGADLIVDSLSFTAGQSFTINNFSLSVKITQ